MINSVRNTVLAIANKNNYGYISPQDFNLYAKQAQMDMFEDYFYAYNNWINRENQRSSGKGYADIVKGLAEVIESFSQQAFLTQYSPITFAGISTSNQFGLPTDYYLIDKVYYYPSKILIDTASAVVGNQFVATNPIFETIPTSQTFPRVNSIIVNTTTLAQARVLQVLNANTLALSADIFATAGDRAVVYSNTNIVDVEKVTQNKIFNLTSANLTAPSKQHPAYVKGDFSTVGQEVITVYPESIDQFGDIQVNYIRYPKDPKWTYQNLGGGGTAFPEEPLFDITQPDYQDFELPLSDEPTLIAKICQYIGIEIRESDVYNFGKAEESLDTQETS